MTSPLIQAAIAHIGRHNRDVINEALSDRHIKKIANMPDTYHDTKRIHDKVFGDGIQNQDIPYSREDEKKLNSHNYNEVMSGTDQSPHYKAIRDHLHKNGYEITDYVSGFAKKKDDPSIDNMTGTQRVADKEEKIGKILNRTNASTEMTNILSKPKYKVTKNEYGDMVHARDARGQKIVESEGKPLSITQAFANDPLRAAKKDVKLVVTRSKEGVAGMSTGKGWRSCMNLDDGVNKKYIPHDIRHGTLTAYLVRNGDDEFDNPVGRVNLKQFVGIDGHRIWRPETNVYGTMPKEATKAIQHWSETRYPHNETDIYSKKPELYDDDGKTTHIFGNPEFDKIQRHVDNQLNDLVSSHYDNANNSGWDEGDQLHQKVEGFLNSIPQAHRNHLIIHSKLTQQDEPTDKYEADRTTDDHIANWAGYEQFDVKSLSDHELARHLKTAEDASVDDARYDSGQLSNATDTHSDLIKEAMSRDNQGTKDNVIHHLVGNFDKNEHWYGNMNDENSHNIPHLHHHTQNSNLLHHLYHIGKEGNIPDLVSDVDDMTNTDATALGHKIGKHGDDEFLHELATEHYDTHEDNGHRGFINGFHSGLNEREDGEERQHRLIGELNLGGGHAMGDHYSGPNNFYADIARRTKFPSVHHALKTRDDTQTPEIQEGIRANPINRS